MKNLTSLILPVFVLTGCQPAQKQPIKHNYHEVKNSLIPWSDVFDQNETDYLVYFYSERCGHCNSIKNDVISYYLTTDRIMYFVCTDIEAMFGNPKDLIGINSISEFYIFGTPFLVRLIEYAVSEYYVGANSILNYINN